MLALPPAPEPLMLPEHYEARPVCASHLRAALEPSEVPNVVDQTIRILSRYQFDAIAFRGLSGSLIAPIVAYKMGKSLLAIRKPKEDAHSSRMVEGDYNARRYVILDDFISSGKTVRAIRDAIAEDVPDALCLGVCTYIGRYDGLKEVPE